MIISSDSYKLHLWSTNNHENWCRFFGDESKPHLDFSQNLI